MHLCTCIYIRHNSRRFINKIKNNTSLIPWLPRPMYSRPLPSPSPSPSFFFFFFSFKFISCPHGTTFAQTRLITIACTNYYRRIIIQLWTTLPRLYDCTRRALYYCISWRNKSTRNVRSFSWHPQISQISTIRICFNKSQTIQIKFGFILYV